MSMDALTARFFSPLVANQTRADESPHNQEVHMRLVHLWRLATRGSLIPCRRTVRRALLLLKRSRPAVWLERAHFKGVHKSCCHASQDHLRPPCPPVLHTPFFFLLLILCCPEAFLQQSHV